MHHHPQNRERAVNPSILTMSGPGGFSRVESNEAFGSTSAGLRGADWSSWGFHHHCQGHPTSIDTRCPRAHWRRSLGTTSDTVLQYLVLSKKSVGQTQEQVKVMFGHTRPLLLADRFCSRFNSSARRSWSCAASSEAKSAVLGLLGRPKSKRSRWTTIARHCVEHKQKQISQPGQMTHRRKL